VFLLFFLGSDAVVVIDRFRHEENNFVRVDLRLALSPIMFFPSPLSRCVKSKTLT